MYVSPFPPTVTHRSHCRPSVPSCCCLGNLSEPKCHVTPSCLTRFPGSPSSEGGVQTLSPPPVPKSHLIPAGPICPELVQTAHVLCWSPFSHTPFLGKHLLGCMDAQRKNDVPFLRGGVGRGFCSRRFQGSPEGSPAALFNWYYLYPLPASSKLCPRSWVSGLLRSSAASNWAHRFPDH